MLCGITGGCAFSDLVVSFSFPFPFTVSLCQLVVAVLFRIGGPFPDWDVETRDRVAY